MRDYSIQSQKFSRIPEASHERQQQLEEEVGRLRREKATLESDLLISQDEPEVSRCSTWLMEHICKRVMMGGFPTIKTQKIVEGHIEKHVGCGRMSCFKLFRHQVINQGNPSFCSHQWNPFLTIEHWGSKNLNNRPVQ